MQVWTLTIFGSGVANFFGGSLNKLAGGIGQISVATTSEAFSGQHTGTQRSRSFRKDILQLRLHGISGSGAGYTAVVVHEQDETGAVSCAAVGENPAAADAAGLNVIKYKYLATCFGGR